MNESEGSVCLVGYTGIVFVGSQGQRSHTRSIEISSSSMDSDIATNRRLAGGQDKDKSPDASDLDEDVEEFIELVEKLGPEAITKEQLEKQEQIQHEMHERRARRRIWRNFTKMTALVIIWIFFALCLMLKAERVSNPQLVAVPANEPLNIYLDQIGRIQSKLVSVKLRGPFKLVHSTSIEADTPQIVVEVQNVQYDVHNVESQFISVSEKWRLMLLVEDSTSMVAKNAEETRLFRLEQSKNVQNGQASKSKMRVQISTSNVLRSIALEAEINTSPVDTDNGIIYAFILLVGLYVMIIWDIVERTFAALLTSTAGIGILSLLDMRPRLEEIVSWIDVNTLMLLFGMMLMVVVLAQTGVFDYMAVFAYRVSLGRVWPLIASLCLFTAITSAFLDNVTIVLLMTPVVIRLCEIMNLRPTKVLIVVVIYANIGGTLTAVGDPPNVIIVSNDAIVASGVDFLTFAEHMAPGCLAAAFVVFLYLYYVLRKPNVLKRPVQRSILELGRTIEAFKQTAAAIPPYTENKEMVRQELLHAASKLTTELHTQPSTHFFTSAEDYSETLLALKQRYVIVDKQLLVKCVIVLVFVITLFFLRSLPFLGGLSLSWIAVLGALLLLILAEKSNMKIMLEQIEWATLLFFAALFVLTEVLGELGLIEWIGHMTIHIIKDVKESHQLPVAIMIILWLSALTSAFVDNIPVTTMMVKVLITLAESNEIQLPLPPLVWALAMGACLGGNGTLIGASANVVCAGISEQHGYRITFIEFFKIGFPVMIISIIVCSVYLMLCHALWSWH